MDRSLRVAMIGRQGSGKGTQARLLTERLALTHVSAGDLLRSEAAGAGATAEAIRGYLDAGALVPDAVVDGLVARAIAAAASGVVLDGYPRTTAQVAVLDRLATLDLVIELDLESDAVLARLLARRTCPECGDVGSALPEATRTCARCGVAMVRRTDDAPDAVRSRLAAYDRTTAPILAIYDARGLLARVDASRPIGDVAADVLAAVEDRVRLATAS